RPVRERGFQRFLVHGPVGPRHPHVPRAGAAHDCVRAVVLVERLKITASSPSLIRESIAAIIASVEPQVTTRFDSGSASIPLKAFARRAIASRSSRAPQVIEY